MAGSVRDPGPPGHEGLLLLKQLYADYLPYFNNRMLISCECFQLWCVVG